MTHSHTPRNRRVLEFLLAISLILSMLVLLPETAFGQATPDYRDALEKAIVFFDANKCGTAVAANNAFPWRGACHISDGNAASPALDLSGGFHDAGDHVKFGLPQGFSAGVLGWSLYEYRADFDREGLTPKTLSTLKYFTDYFLKSHPNATTFYYQVGDGNADHGFWGSPENQTGNRPVLVARTGAPASDILGQHAAALALMSINYRSTDAAYANRCLTAARELFDLGRNNLGRGTDGGGGAFYRSTSHFDDLAWAAIWLSIATGDQTFLAPVDGWISQPNDTNDNPYMKQWTMAWDDMTVANLLKMFELTGQAKYATGLRWNLVWYRDTLRKTPSGLPWLDQWGVLRYASAEAGIGYLAYKKFGFDDFFARGNFIIDYALGNNPRNGSYVTNYRTNPPRHPHHRANEPVQGGPTNGILGALVGGPGQGDDYADVVGDFQKNEVALDYNASFVFGLSGRLYFARGGLPGTPPPPPPPPPMSPPGNGTGLTGTYFQGTAFAGTPLLTRLDPTVNFNFAGGSPAAGIPNDQFSIRWEGQVEARSDELYTFYTNSDDGSRLFVNDQLVVNNFTDHAATEASGTIALALGQRYSIRLEYYENGGDSSVTLSWSTPLGLAKQIIPQTQLFPSNTPPTPNFVLTASPNSLQVGQGSVAASTINIARTNFAEQVMLSATGLPNGVTAAFNPVSTTGNSSTVTFTVASNAVFPSTQVTITGVGGGLTRSTTITLNVAVSDPIFTLVPNPSSVSVTRGATATSVINIIRANFPGSVAFSASGLPGGVTAAFSPTSTTGNNSTLTFTASSTATLGPATVTVTGTSGTLPPVTTTITLTVNPPPTQNYTLSANPSNVPVTRGLTATSAISITRTNFTGSVALTASGLPTGVTATFSPASTTGNTSTLTFTASSTATLGAATVTVTGTSTLTPARTTTITLTVNPAQNFTIAATPASVSVARGGTVTSTINITRTSFTAGVTLSASGLPTGVTAAFNPGAPTGNSSTLTLTASSTATLGAATVTVSGTSGALVRTTTVALNVTNTTGTGGVTVTPIVNANSQWFNEEQIRLSNTGSLTSLSVTIVIQRNPAGVSFSNLYNTAGGQIQNSNSSTTAAITYQFNLAPGQTLGGGGTWTFAAQATGTGTVHPTAGDTYTVTYTTGGTSFTQTGHF